MSGEGLDKVVYVRCTQAEIDQWGEQAKQAGRSLSWWVRHVAAYAATQGIVDPRQLALPFDASAPYPLPTRVLPDALEDGARKAFGVKPLSDAEKRKRARVRRAVPGHVKVRADRKRKVRADRKRKPARKGAKR